MKKLFSILVLFITVFTLSGCALLEETYTQSEIDALIADTYTKEEVDSIVEEVRANAWNTIQEENAVLQAQIDENKATQIDRFLNFLFEYDESYIFIDLNTEYSEVVEAYGYSNTYIYELPEDTMSFQIIIMVDNDLDFTWYSNYANYESTTEEVTPTLFGSPRTYTFDISQPFLILDFESWDMDNDSEVSFVLSIVETEE